MSMVLILDGWMQDSMDQPLSVSLATVSESVLCHDLQVCSVLRAGCALGLRNQSRCANHACLHRIGLSVLQLVLDLNWPICLAAGLGSASATAGACSDNDDVS